MRGALLIVTAVVALAVGGATGPEAFAQTTTAAAGTGGHRTATRNGRVDVNSATEKELETLPGVTPQIAKRIIEGRPYASVTDLSHAGLSANQIKRLRRSVLVGSPARPPR